MIDCDQRQRRQLLPAFAYRHIKELYPIFWSKSAELVQALSGLLSDATSSSPGPSVTVEISQWITRATLDIIGIAGLGEDFHTIQNPDNEICHAYSRVFDNLQHPKSKVKLLAMITKEMLARMLPFERNDVVAQASRQLKNVARRLIEVKRSEKQDLAKASRKDILSVALDSGGFTDEMMVNQLLTFLAAGHETTATSMTWALLALCRHRAVQEELRSEVRANLPSLEDPDAPAMTAELLDGLPYLHAVCNEVLRLHPPAGLTKRVAAKDTSILGHHVPKGTDVVIVMRAINHSKELWGDDAAEFRPERWLESSSGGSDSKFAFMTFLHGTFPSALGFARD